MDKRSSSPGITDKTPVSIGDTRPSLSKLDIPSMPSPVSSTSPSSSSPLGYHPPHRISPSSSSPVRRSPSIRLNPSPERSPLSSPSRRSKLASPLFTSLREKDDPYFLALPDSSRSKILSNSAPDLNTLPHPPPRVHRRPNRDSLLNGNGRLMEQLHSSRRHSTLGVASQQSADNRPLSRRSSIKPPFRLGRTPPSSGSSSPNYGSDSESEIFDDDHSNVGSTVSTRPSSFSSTASFNDALQRPNNVDGKSWKRGSLTTSFSVLDLRKQAVVVLPERDNVEAEDCRFLESEYQRYSILTIKPNHRFISLNPSQQSSSLRRHLLPLFARPSPSHPPSFQLLARKCSVLLKYQNTLLAGLAVRSPLALPERNTFLEAVASICERREWRDYARGMYDETNFQAPVSDASGLSGMAAAMEGFREHERMSYQCVSIAMDYLSKKNFSGTAVEYCGRVLGMCI